MKRCVLLLLSLVTALVVSASCEKETVLTLDQATISFTDVGGLQAVSLTANKPWTVSSNQSWCKVSPSGGEEAASSKITIACDANTSYDERSCTVTFTCAELTKTVSVTQAANNGLLVPQTEYNITNATQQLEIKVQSNVQFNVEVEDDCSDWVKLVSTKSLKESTILLEVSRNDSYEQRSGHITVRQTDGSLWNGAIIIQAPASYLKAEEDSYTLSYLEQVIEIPIISNIDFSIEIENGTSWITVLETKSMKEKIVSLKVEENPGARRVGKVFLKGKDIMTEVQIIQDNDYYIMFEDKNVEACCLKYDTNRDGRLSYEEASSIKQINDLFGDSKHFKSFDEFRYFTGVTQIPESMFENWDQLRKITIPDSVTEIGAYAFNRCESLVSITLSNRTERIGTYAFSNTGIQNINLPTSLKEIGDYAFLNSQINNISIPGSVRNIATGSFSNCKNLKTVEFEVGTEMILKESFANTPLERVSFSNSITEIGSKAFGNCKVLKKIVFPESLKGIGYMAFVDCSNLEEIHFCEGLQYIGIQSFLQCYRLAYVEIPASVTQIDGNAFYSCGLDRVDFYRATPPWLGPHVFSSRETIFYVPKGSLEVYRQSWPEWGDRIKEREEE